MNNALVISALALHLGAISSVGAATLPPLTLSIDENTKTNTRIGDIKFFNGEANDFFTIEVGGDTFFFNSNF